MAETPAPERTPEEEAQELAQAWVRRNNLGTYADHVAFLRVILTRHAEEKRMVEKNAAADRMSLQSDRDALASRLAMAEQFADRGLPKPRHSGDGGLNFVRDLQGRLAAAEARLAEAQAERYNALDRAEDKFHAECERHITERDTLAAQLAQCQHEASTVLEAENAALRKALEDKDPLLGILWPMLRVWGEECQRRKMESRQLIEERDRLANALAQCKADQHATRAFLIQQRDEAREVLKEAQYMINDEWCTWGGWREDGGPPPVHHEVCLAAMKLLGMDPTKAHG